ncbi:MAG: hypothetical protein Q7T36_00270 [Fluviicoccus sp.]|uniref:hypothetical protein n=1 Tax=Fluviicoccus sp. TaxID=2003552 RepID=UPI002728786F|nr:hypothetical protein [Fluviicoccus sp.]MDO8328890.1 hypothetical protein [Fluviicoccus sp.]
MQNWLFLENNPDSKADFLLRPQLQGNAAELLAIQQSAASPVSFMNLPDTLFALECFGSPCKSDPVAGKVPVLVNTLTVSRQNNTLLLRDNPVLFEPSAKSTTPAVSAFENQELSPDGWLSRTGLSLPYDDTRIRRFRLEGRDISAVIEYFGLYHWVSISQGATFGAGAEIFRVDLRLRNESYRTTGISPEAGEVSASLTEFTSRHGLSESNWMSSPLCSLDMEIDWQKDGQPRIKDDYRVRSEMLFQPNGISLNRKSVYHDIYNPFPGELSSTENRQTELANGTWQIRNVNGQTLLKVEPGADLNCLSAGQNFYFTLHNGRVENVFSLPAGTIQTFYLLNQAAMDQLKASVLPQNATE